MRYLLPSNVVQFTTQAPLVLVASSTQSQTGSGAQLTNHNNVSWNSLAPEATQYRVFRQLNGGGYALVATVTGLTYVDSGLASSWVTGEYDYQIVALSASGATLATSNVTTQVWSAPAVLVYSDWSAWTSVLNGVTSLAYAPGLAGASQSKSVLILLTQNQADTQANIFTLANPAGQVVQYGGTTPIFAGLIGDCTILVWDLVAHPPANQNLTFPGTQGGWEFCFMVAYNATTKAVGPQSTQFVSNFSQVFTGVPSGSMLFGVGKTSDSSPPVVTSSDPSTISRAPADPNPYGNGAYTALHQSPAAGNTTFTYPTPSSIWHGITGLVLSP